MDRDEWTKVASGLSLPTLRELHQKIRDVLKDGPQAADFLEQDRIFEAELTSRGETFEPVR